MSARAAATLALFDELVASAKKLPRSVNQRLRDLERVAEAEERRTRCPGCGCTKSGPRCAIITADFEGVCVPRGTLGLQRCSACP